MVATDCVTGRTITLWADELRRRRTAPYPTGEDTIVVAYLASAELTCFLALDWPLPTFVLDLYVEFRAATNGLYTGRHRLIDALAYYGLEALSAAEKDEMRQLAIRGGPFTAMEREQLTAYCATDVAALVKLLPRMLPRLDGDHALLRGGTCARWPAWSTPACRLTCSSWGCSASIGTRSAGSSSPRSTVTSASTMEWPSGNVASSPGWRERAFPGRSCHPVRRPSTTNFREMALRFPVVQPLRTLRRSLTELKPDKLAVGRDGRNRRLLSPFGSKPGRNTPSSTEFIFGPPKWARALIRPAPRTAIAYLDWQQQEFAIAAALSRDETMLACYEAGDPYLAFGKQAGLIPADGTKESHGAVRDLCKTTVLAVQYGGGASLVGQRTNRSPGAGRELLNLHRRTFKRFWAWSDAAVNHAFLRNRLQTEFGWTVRVGRDANPRSFRNFPMQRTARK